MNKYILLPHARVYAAEVDPPLTVVSPLASYTASSLLLLLLLLWLFSSSSCIIHDIIILYIIWYTIGKKTNHAQFSIRLQWQRWRHKNKRATARRFDFSGRIIASDTLLLPIIKNKKKKKCISKKEISKNTLFFLLRAQTLRIACR